MICAFLFKACDTLLPSVTNHQDFVSIENPGVTVEVPFSSLEELTFTQVKAIQTDDRGVYLSCWTGARGDHRSCLCTGSVEKFCHTLVEKILGAIGKYLAHMSQEFKVRLGRSD